MSRPVSESAHPSASSLPDLEQFKMAVLNTQDYRVLTNLTTTPPSLLFVRFHPELGAFNRQSDQSVDELSEAFDICPQIPSRF